VSLILLGERLPLVSAEIRLYGHVEYLESRADDVSDYQLALKQYLRAIEMTTPAEGQIEASPSGTRLWWGVKQVCRTFFQ
jgi:hypothetical protein